MRWFRFYAEVVHDPKVQQLPAATFKQWVNLLCIACENEGALPPEQHIAYTMRMSVQSCRNMLIEFKRLGLLDQDSKGVLKPHNWDSRQFQSDVSTERVRKFRERKKRSSETAPETFQKLPRARDTDTETDTDKTPVVPLQAHEIGESPYEKFVAAFVGPVEPDLWQHFPRYVSAQDAPCLIENTILWMQTKRYRDGFYSAHSFLRSKVWTKPPSAALLANNGTTHQRTLSRAEEMLRDA